MVYKIRYDDVLRVQGGIDHLLRYSLRFVGSRPAVGGCMGSTQ